MNRITFFSRVGADGVLHVEVPVGATEANRPVQVTIEPARNGSESAEDYHAWLRQLAGRWQGEFVRGDEGAFETREFLP